MVVDTAVMSDTNHEENITPSEEDLEHDYTCNLANGKKNLLCGDFPEAVTCFEAACATQSARFGETAAECAEAFFYYGRSLFELARVENGVLGNALKGVPETDDADSDSEQFEETRNITVKERELMRGDVVKAMAAESEDGDDSEGIKSDENEDKINGLPRIVREATDRFIRTGHFTQPKSSSRSLFGNEASGKKDDKLNDIVKDESQTQISERKKEASTSSDQPGTSSEPSTSNGEKVNEEDPDDLSNMQLAWEMLELAKVLYAKKPKSKDNNLMVAECNQKLGDLGLEIESYEQAIGDYLESLKIHKDHLEEHDRRFAETHYSLGLAYHMARQCDKAEEHYKHALRVLEARIDHLNSLIDAKNDEDTEVMEACTEVGNIKDLIPEINAKIEDVVAMKREHREMVMSALGDAGESSVGFKSSGEASTPVCTVIPVRKDVAGSSSASDQSVNDISHLIRRKKRSAEEDDNCNKKLKQDPELNGSSSQKDDVVLDNPSTAANSSEKLKTNEPGSDVKESTVETQQSCTETVETEAAS